MSTHGDGGKGSGRRKEDASKVRDNWDLIWGKKKEQPMIDEHDDEDDGYEICHHCSGSGEGMYEGSRCGFCHGTGEAPVERGCDDFDFPDEDDYDND